jgi:predicted dehydrogenase
MLRVAIAGLGRWGQTLVSSVQGRSEKIRFVAGCTGRKDRAREFCERNHIDLRDGLGDLLGDPAIDGVVLATPHSQHADQIIASAAARKPVFVEKPFTLTRESAVRAIAACETAGIVCALGHNRRFLPAMRKLAGTVKGGEIGRVQHVEAQFSSEGGHRYTAEFWRSSRAESPAGGMTALGIHAVDALISVFGEVSEVQALSERRVVAIDIDDTTAVMLRFTSGVTGYLGTIITTPLFWRIHAFGDAGWAEMRQDARLSIKKRGGEEEVTEFAPTDSVRAELEAFADAAAGKAPYPLPWNEAVHGIAVMEAVERAARAGGWVKVA